MITLPPFLEVIEALKEIEFRRTDLRCLQEFNLCPSKKHWGLCNLNQARKIMAKFIREGNSTDCLESDNYFTSEKHLLKWEYLKLNIEEFEN